MIRNTEKLIRDFKNNPRMDGTILASYCRITSLYGDRNDAAALFRLFAEEPYFDMKDIMRLDLHKGETLEVEALIVHSLQVLHDLMEVKLIDDLHPPRFAATNNERFSDLYAQLFQWSNEYEDDSMIGRIQHVLGYDHPMVNQYIVLRTRMEMAIRREMELEALRLQP
ncbi:hypothetical protein [Paenibacillus sp. JZ16]|uniref:hypothetical protein n=1 Tax=Paenibacillus sp. JZ16 TaxID=1906272 RepID=UPI00188BFF70|nr:hypothetical protein [Paenibacillus sp. JZ16]